MFEPNYWPIVWVGLAILAVGIPFAILFSLGVRNEERERRERRS